MTAPEPGRADVALVVVHGIGEQARGRTLLSWGEPIARRMHVIARQAGGDGVRVTRSRLTRGDEPTEFDLEVDLGEHDRQRWVRTIHLSEARWADAFLTVGSAEVLRWGRLFLFRAFGRFARHVARQSWSVRLLMQERAKQVRLLRMPTGLDGRTARLVQLLLSAVLGLGIPAVVLAAGAVLLLLALLGAVLVALLTVVLAVAAAIPLVKKPLRGLLTGLVTSVGDATAWTTHPVLAAAMRDCVVDEIARAHERAGSVVVLGHSQGAAVCADVVLYSRTPPPVDVLITAGGAVRLLGTSVWAGDELPPPPVRTWADERREIDWINVWAGWDPVPSGPVADTTAGTTERWRETYAVALARVISQTAFLRQRFGKPAPPLPTDVPLEIAPTRLPTFTVLGPAEWPVHNRASLLSDHTTYTDNVPQVIDPLARLLLERAGIPGPLPPADVSAAEGHVTAVRLLGALRLGAAASALCAVLALTSSGTDLPVLSWLTGAVQPLNKTAFGGLTWLGKQSWDGTAQLVISWVILTGMLRAVAQLLWSRCANAYAWGAHRSRVIWALLLFATYAAAVTWPTFWLVRSLANQIDGGQPWLVVAGVVVGLTAVALPLLGLRPAPLAARTA